MAKTLIADLSLQYWLPQLILLAFIAFLFFIKHKIASFKGLNLAPSPPKLPIIGNLHQWTKLPHRSLLQLSRKYGPIMQLQLGYVPAIIISSPEAAKEVLKTNDLDTCTRPASQGPRKFSYNYLDIASSPYGDYWRETRKIFVVELMTTKRARSLWKAREEEVTRLTEFLSSNSGNPVELNRKILELNDGIIANVALGKFCGKDQFGGKNFQDVINRAIEAMGSFAVEDFFPTWWARVIDKLSGYSSRLDNSFRDLDGYFQMLLNKHRSPERSVPVEDEDFVDVLIALQKDSDNYHTLTDCSIKALIMNTFLGGTDTSSVTILWAMAELMKNPRVMKKVQTEIRSCVGEKQILVEESDIANLNYLKMVVKETLRLHPVAPLLVPHEAIRNCRIGGYDVFPGTRIFVNAWAIGRDPNSWESPEEFDPDRFEGKDIDFKGQNFMLLPFGSGRRVCPGIAMGVGTVEFVLANMLYSFDWKLPEGIKCEEMSMEEEGSGLAVHRKEQLHVVPIIKYKD